MRAPPRRTGRPCSRRRALTRRNSIRCRQWLPPFAFDRRASWSGQTPERRDVTLRVEAASYRGRPVWFGVFGPWSRPSRQGGSPVTPSERAGAIVLASIFLLLLAACVTLARRNLRLGRGDRQGAWRLAMYVFALGLLSWVLGGAHVPTLYELYLFCSAAGGSLFLAAFVGAAYLALEPIVRRRWPHVIIGWSRVLSGKISDALVGRDLLIGVAAGLIIQTCGGFMLLSHSNPARLILVLDGLTGLRQAMSALSVTLGTTIFLCLGICLLYAASYIGLRRHWLAGGVVVGLLTVPDLLGSGLAPDSVASTLNTIVSIVVLTRFGLLALMASVYVSGLLDFFPVTTDLTQWYASTDLIGVVAILALAVWAFRTSLGGQLVFKDA
jgi:hypothetical protein